MARPFVRVMLGVKQNWVFNLAKHVKLPMRGLQLLIKGFQACRVVLVSPEFRDVNGDA